MKLSFISANSVRRGEKGERSLLADKNKGDNYYRKIIMIITHSSTKRRGKA
jgi:hypothetical protein